MNASPITRIILPNQITELSRMAASLPRGRKNLNLHPELESPVQRLFNAMEPCTYVRPHRHARSNGWELMLRISGAFAVILFNESGTIMEKQIMDDHGGPIALEIPAQTWHSVIALETGTVMFEVKEGPYSPVEDKDFAAWGPAENTPEAGLFLRWLLDAPPGATVPEGWPTVEC